MNELQQSSLQDDVAQQNKNPEGLTVKTKSLGQRATLIGQVIFFNGILFFALGTYLILQTGTWQAYALTGCALEVTIGALIGTFLIKRHLQSIGGWVLFITNIITPAVAGLAVTRIGLISAPYIAITSYLIIRIVLPGYRRKPATYIAGIATLLAIAIEILNPAWTLNTKIVLTLGPVFIVTSITLGFFTWFFGIVWVNFSVRAKLITSISALSMILIGVLTFGSIRSLLQQSETEELQQLTITYENYNNYVASLEDTAVSLAISLADRKDVIGLHQARDRQGLLDLLTPLFNTLKENYNIVHMYIEDPDGTVFIRIHNPGSFGDDVTYRRTANAALSSKQPVAGVEIGPSRLGVRGVAPIYINGQFVGMTEVGIDYDQAFIDHLKETTGADYTMWLTRDAAQPAGLQPPQNHLESPTNELFFYASTYQGMLPIQGDVFTRVLESGTPETQYVSDGKQELVVLVAPLLGYGNRTIGIFEIISSRTQTLESIRKEFTGSIGIAAIVSVIGFLSLLIISQLIILRPIAKLTTTSRQQLAGDLAVRVPELANDEFGELGKTLNALTENLQSSLQGLEERVADRTADLEQASQQIEYRAAQFESIAQVSRIISSIQNLDDLLPRITRMISQYFGFYHAGIFLLDDNREFAVLRAANSEGGHRMLERKHRLEVGQSGIVGYVTATGNPRIALDTGADAVYFDNPDMPDTRSEMALPLRAGGSIIGALDVQSEKANAFTQEDVNILSALADQVSTAIQNARSYEESRKALAQAESAYRQLTGQAWSKIQNATPVTGYRYNGIKPEPMTQPENGRQFAAQKDAFSVPVQLRGVSIGKLQIKAAEDGHQWTEDEITIIRATAERVALATENARLVLESQKRASKEQVIGEISTKIGAAINIDNILQTTLREMGRILPGAEISIQVENE